MARVRSTFTPAAPRDIPDTVFVEYKPTHQETPSGSTLRERLAFWMTVAIAVATGLLIYTGRI